MEEHKLGLTVLAIVAVLALASFVVLYKQSTALAVYEQPAGNKPAFIHSSKYLEGFDLCKQFLCTYGEVFGESEPALLLGIEPLTGLLRCGCSDGREFLIRPDRIEEGGAY